MRNLVAVLVGLLGFVVLSAGCGDVVVAPDDDCGDHGPCAPGALCVDDACLDFGDGVCWELVVCSANCEDDADCVAECFSDIEPAEDYTPLLDCFKKRCPDGDRDCYAEHCGDELHACLGLDH